MAKIVEISKELESLTTYNIAEIKLLLSSEYKWSPARIAKSFKISKEVVEIIKNRRR